MMTLKVDPDKIDAGAVRTAADAVKRGRLVVLPTNGEYMIAADASNKGAVKRLFDATDRPARQGLTLLIGRVDQALEVAEFVPDKARFMAQRYWPGPLVLVVNRGVTIARGVTGEHETVGVYVPEDPTAHALLTELGTPLAVAPAVTYGGVPPRDALGAIENVGSGVDIVLDEGKLAVGRSLTIVDVSGLPPRLIRHGTIPADEIRAFLPDVQELAAAA